MFNRQDMKASAKTMLKGNIWFLFVCALIVMIITGALSWLFLSGLTDFLISLPGKLNPDGSITTVAEIAANGYQEIGNASLNWREMLSTLLDLFVLVPLSAGFISVLLNLYKDSHTKKFAYLFAGYNRKNYIRIIATSLLIGFFTTLWSFLFVIPGIIKSFSYSQAMYLIMEDSSIHPLAAIRKSKRMMRGHKVELFVLGLSFILWNLLIPLTAGVAALYVIPYEAMTFVVYHKRLLYEYQNQRVEININF